MFDELFAAERAASLEESTRRPYQPPMPPGIFTGFGSALADIVPNAVLTTGNAWSGVLDAYGKAAAYRDAPAAALLAGRPAPDMGELQRQTVDQMGDNELGPVLRREAKRYAPDPLAVGVAGQIVHGVGTSLAKAGAYSLAGPFAPVLFGADVGINRTDELKDQGVDGGTAALAGLASGAAGAIGMRLPAALGATRLQSAAIGAVANPALNVAEVGGIHALLEHADYPQIAARYQPLDPLSLAVASITGAAFGAAFHGGKAHSQGARADTPTLDPEAHAAALTMNEVRTREADTLVKHDDIQAMNRASDAQVLAREQMDAGEPVSVSHLVDPDISTLEAARATALGRMTGDLRAELLAEAGNRADPGEVPAARASLDELQSDIERIQTDQAFKEEAKAQQRRGLSRKQAEAAARDALGQQQADMRAQMERLNNFIEANSRAARAEQDLADLNRGVIPARFLGRIEDAAQAARRGLQPTPITGAVRELFNSPARSAEPTQPTVESTPPAPAPAPAGESAPGSVAQRIRDAASAIVGRKPAAPVPRALKADTPEQVRAFDLAGRAPDAVISTGEMDAEGNPIQARVSDMIRQAQDIEQQAKVDTQAFQAAVNCALRFLQ